MGGRRWVVGCAVLAAAAVAGCGGSSPSHPHASEAAVDIHGKHIGVTAPSVIKGEQTVPLKVIQGHNRATIAVVPVWINGSGPYPFALDTGATSSLVDSHLVNQLGLHSAPGVAPTLSGVTGSAKGQLVHVHSWRAGAVVLHPAAIASLDLGGSSGQGPQGLLGSDVLSMYGKIAIDYNRDLLILDPRAVR